MPPIELFEDIIALFFSSASARISLNFFDLRRLLNKNNLKINLSQHLQDYIAAEDGTTNLLIEVFNIVKVM